MIYSVRGKLLSTTPTYSVVEAGGIGYQIHHSIHTYEALQGKAEVFLHTHFIVREDAQLLFGFFEKVERDVFLLLNSVSGVGPNSARLILSHLKASDVVRVIGAGQSDVLRSVKGIGAKTAERIIVDLKDKITSIETASDSGELPMGSGVDSRLMADALSALEVLGYARASATKAVRKALEQSEITSVDQVIREALKNL
ncbi:MAG: Holliday junction branch migration protein RuvA [Flavobacteriales bacterium]|jgi:Holliday junction DNA helicase RuvA|nr:MAG: Holliday junction branch migration protein RuvA [Flavobacteriales bacterium]